FEEPKIHFGHVAEFRPAPPAPFPGVPVQLGPPGWRCPLASAGHPRHHVRTDHVPHGMTAHRHLSAATPLLYPSAPSAFTGPARPLRTLRRVVAEADTCSTVSRHARPREMSEGVVNVCSSIHRMHGR